MAVTAVPRYSPAGGAGRARAVWSSWPAPSAAGRRLRRGDLWRQGRTAQAQPPSRHCTWQALCSKHAPQQRQGPHVAGGAPSGGLQLQDYFQQVYRHDDGCLDDARGAPRPVDLRSRDLGGSSQREGMAFWAGAPAARARRWPAHARTCESDSSGWPLPSTAPPGPARARPAAPKAWKTTAFWSVHVARG